MRKQLVGGRLDKKQAKQNAPLEREAFALQICSQPTLLSNIDEARIASWSNRALLRRASVSLGMQRI
jgi:hypothetical protein